MSQRGIGRGDELDERHEQHRRVEVVGVVVLDERLTLLVPAPRHDLVVDRVARLEPADEVGGEAALKRAIRIARSIATQDISRE